MTNDVEIGSVVDLRRAFDQSFADPLDDEREPIVRFVALRIGGDPYAIRVTEIAGLTSTRRIVPLPSALPQLIGLAANRGVIIPVFDLAMLLGYEARRDETKWVVLTQGKEPVGLSCFALDGYLELPRSRISDGAEADQRRSGHDHVRQTMRACDGLRGIIDIASIVDAITKDAAVRTARER